MTRRRIVEYLDRLGISHCYASSYFRAVPGSTHGYDVADPTQLNPEIGTRESYDRWVATLRATAWATSSTWCRTIWASRSRATRGGRTCSRTVQARAMRIVFRHRLASAETGAHATGSCCQSSATPTARCSSGRKSRCSYVNGAFTAHYFNTVLPIAPGSYDRILELDAEALLARSARRPMTARSSSAS